jgi:translation initiation factor 2A
VLELWFTIVPSGSATSHCATTHAWSPDSRYFMTASLAPRMNVDNNLKLFKYNGYGPVLQLPFDRAYDVLWRPQLPSVYPNRGPSPKRLGGGDEAAAAASASASASAAAMTSKPAVAVSKPYRPPGKVFLR